MQLWLPSPVYSDSASMLDDNTLSRTRLNVLHVMTSLVAIPHYVQHPVVRLWEGYEWALLDYQRSIVAEWRKRGHSDSILWKTFDIMSGSPSRPIDEPPHWLGDRSFHEAQQSGLIRLNSEHYRPQFPDVSRDLTYIYPVKD